MELEKKEETAEPLNPNFLFIHLTKFPKSERERDIFIDQPSESRSVKRETNKKLNNKTSKWKKLSLVLKCLLCYKISEKQPSSRLP